MDIVQVSNIFNALAQLHPDIKFYHGGLHEKINQNGIDNNFDPTNCTGKQYPLVWFPYEAVEGVKTLRNQKQADTMRVTLAFYDLMFYNNDSSCNERTEIEIARDLDAIAIGFIAAIRKASRAEIAGNICNWLEVASDIQYRYIPYQHNDRLMCITYEFDLKFSAECQAFDPDFNLLTPPNAVPVPDYDLEDPNHP
jgi:hypothetical protein